MTFWLHLSNLIVHIACGALAIAIGMFLLAATKGTQRHSYWGRIFIYLGLIVCTTAAIGNVFFRFMPLFATLTLLVLYLLTSGWRVIYTRGKGPTPVDLWVCIAGYVAAVSLTFILVRSTIDSAPVVIYSTLGALAVVLIYDLARWVFPKHWHEILWRYEHVYKIVSSLFAMISALFGNTLRAGQPWSQLIPSVVGVFAIAYFFTQLYRNNHKESTLPASSALNK